jgi:hypothetical protein
VVTALLSNNQHCGPNVVALWKTAPAWSPIGVSRGTCRRSGKRRWISTDKPACHQEPQGMQDSAEKRPIRGCDAGRDSSKPHSANVDVVALGIGF